MEAKLKEVLEANVAKGDDTKDKLLGASFILFNKEKTLFSGSAGRIGLATDAPAFATNSFTWAASMGKIITSTCLMQIVEKGLIGLDDDVRKLVPELGKMQILRGFEGEVPKLEDNTTPITLRILMTHTLGLGYDVADPEIIKWSALNNRTDNCLTWNRNGFDTPIKYAPGESWVYGPALDWAALVLEAVTGQTLGQYMDAHIFEPLGMKDTTFWPEKIQDRVQDRTIDWVNRGEDGTLQAMPAFVPKEHDIESGGAGLFSTAQDLSTFHIALYSGALLKPESLDALFTPQLNSSQTSSLQDMCYIAGRYAGMAPEFPDGLPLNHGLGGLMNTEDAPGKRKKGSLSWSGMLNSRWWIDRETGVGGVMFVSVQPFRDGVAIKLYDELERAVYESLGQ